MLRCRGMLGQGGGRDLGGIEEGREKKRGKKSGMGGDEQEIEQRRKGDVAMKAGGRRGILF